MARRTTKVADHSLLVSVTEEDIAVAVVQDQYNCAIARSIQRSRPDAYRVRVSKDTIALTILSDRLPGEQQGVRYTFRTPQDAIDNIISPFDKGQPVKPFDFVLSDAIKAVPMAHNTSGDERRAVERARFRLNASDRARRARTQNPAVRTYGRFLDANAEDAS